MAIRTLNKTLTYATEAQLAARFPEMADGGAFNMVAADREEFLYAAETYVDYYIGSGRKYKSSFEGQTTIFPREADCVLTCYMGDHNFSTELPEDPMAGHYYSVTAGGTIGSYTFTAGNYALYFGGQWIDQSAKPDEKECFMPFQVTEAVMLMAYVLRLEKDIFDSSTGLTTSAAGSCIESGMSVRIGPMTIKKAADSESYTWWTLNSSRDAFASGRSAMIDFLSSFEYGRRFMAYLQPFTNKLGGHNFF